MKYNIAQEVTKKNDCHRAWTISLKYSVYLMNNIDKSIDVYSLVTQIYKQYISELQSNKLVSNKDKKYIQVWNTVINTLRNINVKLHKRSIKLLHQTNVQRVDRIH